MERILDALSRLRVGPALDELQVQDQIAQCLSEGGLSFEREKRIGPGCRVDFLLADGVALEVKARKRPRRALTDQLRRYCACEPVRALILVTNQPACVASSYCGKPVRLIRLNALWGVAL